jgi:hypothetical protein
MTVWIAEVGGDEVPPFVRPDGPWFGLEGNSGRFLRSENDAGDLYVGG